jgi:HEAT repeat protein
VRSKVAILFGRGQCRADWAATDGDPRVRANAIEALWGVDRPANRKLLWKSVYDPHNRVAGNAILGLLRLNDLGVVANLRRMATHPSSAHRATAAWVIGRSGNPELLPILRGMRDDPEENVRRNVERSLALLEPPQPVLTPAEAAAPPEPAPTPPPAEAPDTEAPHDAGSGRYVRTRGIVFDNA